MAATTDISRRSFIKGTAVLAAMIPLSSILAACSSDEQSSGSNAQSESSILVAYYSAQGHTESVANTLADELNADTFVITPTQPYTTWQEQETGKKGYVLVQVLTKKKFVNGQMNSDLTKQFS